MYDGAAGSYPENVALTREVVGLAHAAGASAEAELGEVGHALRGDTGTSRTNVAEAERFVAATGIDALAVAIGTIHGMAETGATVDLPLVAELRQRVPIPLVMHGSSGVDDDALRRAIAAGIAKVNLSTALQRVFLDALRGNLSAHRTDARAVLAEARAAVEEHARRRIRVVGASGRAI
jgi:fructose-bisphosphate aldolase class II